MLYNFISFYTFCKYYFTISYCNIYDMRNIAELEMISFNYIIKLKTIEELIEVILILTFPLPL